MQVVGAYRISTPKAKASALLTHPIKPELLDETHYFFHIYGYYDILLCMKTTVEISEKLLKTAKKYAAERGLSLKTVIESALRNMLENNKRPVKFSLKDGSVKGNGISKEFEHESWQSLRQAIYKGRGE